MRLNVVFTFFASVMPLVGFAQEVAVAKEIAGLVAKRYEHANAADFQSVSDRLMKLGVVRETYDVLSNRLDIYNATQLLATVTPPVDSSRWVLGTKLDVKVLAEAIKGIDDGKIDAAEFHRLAAAAGVVTVSLHPAQSKIVYIGCDGATFTESY